MAVVCGEKLPVQPGFPTPVNAVKPNLFGAQAKVIQMLSWPQLATALAGGIIAFAVLKWLKRI